MDNQEIVTAINTITSMAGFVCIPGGMLGLASLLALKKATEIKGGPTISATILRKNMCPDKRNAYTALDINKIRPIR